MNEKEIITKYGSFGNTYLHYLNRVWNPVEWYKDYQGINAPHKDSTLTNIGRGGVGAALAFLMAAGGVKAAPALAAKFGPSMPAMPKLGIGKMLAGIKPAISQRATQATTATSRGAQNLVARLKQLLGSTANTAGQTGWSTNFAPAAGAAKASVNPSVAQRASQAVAANAGNQTGWSTNFAPAAGAAKAPSKAPFTARDILNSASHLFTSMGGSPV